MKPLYHFHVWLPMMLGAIVGALCLHLMGEPMVWAWYFLATTIGIELMFRFFNRTRTPRT